MNLLGTVALASLSLISLWLAIGYGLWSFGAPGAGLMPGVAACILLIASLAAAREKVAADEQSSDRRRLLIYGVGLLFLLAAIPVVGMIAALGVFVLLLLRVAERMTWVSSLGIAVLSVGLSWLLFERLLQVPLPGPLFR